MTEDLAQEVARMRAEMAQLRADNARQDAEIAVLQARLTAGGDDVCAPGAASRASAVPVSAPGAGGSWSAMSRRGAIAAAVGGAGAAIVGLVGAQPAAAAAGNSLILGAVNDAGGSNTLLRSNSGTTLSVDSSGTSNKYSIYGLLRGQSGLLADAAAVTGDSDTFIGVQGISSGYYGVFGKSTDSIGVRADGRTFGVYATASGTGVAGFSDAATSQGVYGQNDHGIGVRGDSYFATSVGVQGGNSLGVGVLGTSSSNAGVSGVSISGVGVSGKSSSSIGVTAQGGRAPLRLVPASKAGKPTTGSHSIGEIYCDSAGALYVCTVAGTPGTWKKVTVS